MVQTMEDHPPEHEKNVPARWNLKKCLVKEENQYVSTTMIFMKREKDEDQAVIQFKKRVLVATGISNHKSIKKKLSTPSKPRTFSGGEEQAIRRIKLSTNIMAPKKRPTLNGNFYKFTRLFLGRFAL
nr:PREDICTED: uncharacterized protein LOC107399167 [Tribolium castaneum]|eukprot:XP_015840381.1 PREDICTED: uncharacterized protein LOC107399167 [Tribolium castaneum]